MPLLSKKKYQSEKLSRKQRNPWLWVPSLYFIEGLPNVIIAALSVLMYKKMGVSDGDAAFYASLIYLPYFIKPLWSPFIDIYRTKRWWIVVMQITLALTCAAMAFLLPTPFFVSATVATFFLISFASATHDIAADGFYIIALDSHNQSFFVGIRSTFYRFSTLFAKGAIVFFIGLLEISLGDVPKAWSIGFLVFALLFFVAMLFHGRYLPRPSEDKGENHKTAKQVGKEFADTFVSFFKRPGIIGAMFFILFYRFPESLLDKMIQPFLISDSSQGGVGLTTYELGLTYGVIGVIGIILGGIIGGITMSRFGLKKMLMPMALSMSLTCFGFLLLSYVESPSRFLIDSVVFVEQFGYGFGFSAYMLYLLYFVRGKLSTSHYAICTGFMALGLMLPGMFAGYLKDIVGYQTFFLIAVCSCVVTVIVSLAVKVEGNFGRKDYIEPNSLS